MRKNESVEIPLPHVGEILKDYLAAVGATQYQLGIATGIPHSQITEIIKGRRGMSAAVAARIAKAFGTSAQLWLGYQQAWELDRVMRTDADAIAAVRELAAA